MVRGAVNTLTLGFAMLKAEKHVIIGNADRVGKKNSHNIERIMGFICTIPDEVIVGLGDWGKSATFSSRGQERVKLVHKGLNSLHQRFEPPGAMMLNPATQLMRVLAKARRDKRVNNIFF